MSVTDSKKPAKPTIVKPVAVTKPAVNTANQIAEKTASDAAKAATKPSIVTPAKEVTKKAAAKPTAKKKPAAKKAAQKKVASKKPAAKKAAPKKAAAKKTDKVVSISKSAVRDIFTSTSDEAKKAQEQVLAIGLDSAEHFNRGAEISSKLINESVAISQENIEACVEASTIAAEHANTIGESTIGYANDAMSDNVEISKDFFSCRTASDVFELQNKFFQSNVERFFAESAALTDMVFDMTSQSAEPFSERAAEVADRLNKAFN